LRVPKEVIADPCFRAGWLEFEAVLITLDRGPGRNPIVGLYPAHVRASCALLEMEQHRNSPF
jgi:hypothetical protein